LKTTTTKKHNNKNEIIINKWGRHYQKPKYRQKEKYLQKHKTKIISGTTEQTFTFYNIIIFFFF
jgi:hypothetical protein